MNGNEESCYKYPPSILAFQIHISWVTGNFPICNKEQSLVLPLTKHCIYNQYCISIQSTVVKLFKSSKSDDLTFDNDTCTAAVFFESFKKDFKNWLIDSTVTLNMKLS